MNNTQLYFDVSGAIENNNFPLTGLYVDAQLTDTWGGNNLWYSISSISGNAGAISVQVNNEGHIVDGAFAGTTTTLPPTTQAPTTQAPTTQAPTTQAPTTQAPTTQAPTTQAPTTQAPTTQAPTTQAPTTQAPTTQAPTTQAPTTQAPTTQAPTTQAPTTQAPTTQAPTTQAPTTQTITLQGFISSPASISSQMPAGWSDFTIVSESESYSQAGNEFLISLSRFSSTEVQYEFFDNVTFQVFTDLLNGATLTFDIQEA